MHFILRSTPMTRSSEEAPPPPKKRGRPLGVVHTKPRKKRNGVLPQIHKKEVVWLGAGVRRPALNPIPQTLYHEPYTLNPKPCTPNSEL